nr:ATP-binding protein [Paenibacillus shirakamiensis]
MMLMAKQISLAVEQSRESSEYAERQMAKKLRLASIIAQHELGPDINNVTSTQLVAISKKVEVSGIALFVKKADDIIIAQSSNPKEIGLSTKKWDLWYAALNQLLDNKEIDIKQGYTLKDFWTGPFEYAVSNPGYIEKWGYYYDGTSNYIIDPYINGEEVDEYFKIINPDSIIDKSREANAGIMEITGINPDPFTITNRWGGSFESQKSVARNDRPIAFGTYKLRNPQEDMKQMKEALDRSTVTQYEERMNGERIIKTFVPIHSNSENRSYIIRIISSYDPIYSVISKQMVSQIAISLVLLEIVIFASYILAGLLIRPIQDILIKVNGMADGDFGTALEVTRKDELGLLATRINAMARNLVRYTRDLREINDENRSVKEHLESIIRQTADAIHLTDPAGRVIRVNKAFEHLYGWSSEEVIGKTLVYIPKAYEQEEQSWFYQLHKGIPIISAETMRLHKDGHEVRVSVSQSPIVDEEGQITAFVIISRDMSERNRMEELLRRSEKLTTVGQLAAGVAHEIRNPLTTLKGFLQLQQRSLQVNLRHTDIMMSELERINLIVSEFLILAKPQAVHFQTKDIRYILGDVISLLDSQAHLLGIEFNPSFSQETLLIFCEENQLKQVFINLFKNAMEAMPEGGVVHLHTWRGDKRSVVIQIRDEGCGIPKDILAKIGEPFFTSKETGTGLGLMVSQRIIESHKGTLDIESELNQGTTITLMLPMVAVRK